MIDFREIITFYENPFSGSRLITCAQKYRQIWETVQTPFTVFKKSKKYDTPECIITLLVVCSYFVQLLKCFTDYLTKVKPVVLRDLL